MGNWNFKQNFIVCLFVCLFVSLYRVRVHVAELDLPQDGLSILVISTVISELRIFAHYMTKHLAPTTQSGTQLYLNVHLTSVLDQLVMLQVDISTAVKVPSQ